MPLFRLADRGTCRALVLNSSKEFSRKLPAAVSSASSVDVAMQNYVQACGSGGTTAGIALGNHLSRYGAKIWAFGVCDDPDYFYEYIDGIFKDLGAPAGQPSYTSLRSWICRKSRYLSLGKGDVARL